MVNAYAVTDILSILDNVTKGDFSKVCDVSVMTETNKIILELITHPNAWTQEDIQYVDAVIRISNIMYNNSTLHTLLLDDGVYDQLLVIYKKYNPSYQVGSTPTEIVDKSESTKETISDKKVMCHSVDNSKLNSTLYARAIQAQHTPLIMVQPKQICTMIREPISKRLINTEHKYPQLVGTLDKCKFVLNNDAKMNNVLDDPSVQVFERDFIHACITQGIIGVNETFDMLAELKYDGVSVEAEVLGNKIISAYSRGDTGANIATDLTPIFSDYIFRYASEVPVDQPFGIKFEAVMTYRDLERFSNIKGKDYKNGRNAIIGLLGSSDAYRFVNYITLIPISTSLDWSQYGNNGRLAELDFLNKYYHSGELNRYCLLSGNYMEILFQAKEFLDSAETIRPILPYMIDGIVLSFIDPNKIRFLGRVNSVNKWQMAVKFNPREARTIFTGYSYNIGKSGDIIPMVHFKPVEFMGTIHTKQTAHSYQRFKELALVPGQEIDIKYVNDVLTYITKPDTEYNRNLQNTQYPEKFIEYCPYCGSKIQISETDKSAKCPNVNCHERRIMRMVDMLDKLGFKDISEETIRLLDQHIPNGFNSFINLITPYSQDLLTSIIGPLTAVKFMSYQQKLINEPINDYILMAALSFDGLSTEKWKMVLSKYDLKTLFNYTRDQLWGILQGIRGVGPGIVTSIINGFNDYNVEVQCIINMPNLINSCNLSKRPRVVISGFRDDNLIEDLNNMGYDCSDGYGVTKETTYLIAADINSNSTKLRKARQYNIPIISLDDYIIKGIPSL